MAADDDIEALLASLGHAPDDDLAEASAQRRSHRRWLRQQAAQSATMAGALLTLAERGDPVTLRCGPWTHHGRLRSVTAALALVEVAGGLALLPTGSITAVEAPELVADDRSPGPGPDLAGVLADLTIERPGVRLLLADGTEVAGTLWELGKDVACVRLRSTAATVRLSAVTGCVLLGPGNVDRAGSA